MRGIVVTGDGKPMPNVAIFNKYLDYGVFAYTDSQGKFELKWLRKIDTLSIAAPNLYMRIVNQGSRYIKIVAPAFNPIMNAITGVTIEGKNNNTLSQKTLQLVAIGNFNVFATYSVEADIKGEVNKLISDIKANLTYPKKAIDNNIEGTVVIKFTIDKAGKMKDFDVIQGLGYGCDEEAIRVLKQYKQLWKPAAYYGNLVETQKSIAIQFKLTDK